jgi:hypothetical protein
MAGRTKGNAGRSSATGEQSTFELSPAFVIVSDDPCSRCGRRIYTIDKGEFIESEYRDAEGRCWDCAAVKK